MVLREVVVAAVAATLNLVRFSSTPTIIIPTPFPPLLSPSSLPIALSLTLLPTPSPCRGRSPRVRLLALPLRPIQSR